METKPPTDSYMPGHRAPHLLVFEPRVEGHHLAWLRYVVEDFLAAGFRLTLAIDSRPEARDRVHLKLANLTADVQFVAATDAGGNFRAGGKLRAIAACLQASGAQEVFLPNLDEIASRCLRLAAVGILPPRLLRGRLSGVYFRPRFLASPFWPPGNLLKGMGLRRMGRGRWFQRVWVLDEYLRAASAERCGVPRLEFLPDPWSGDFTHPQHEARRKLGIPRKRRVFLSFGIGARRKGLHLVLRAMQRLPDRSDALLLCAGRIAADREIIAGLRRLEARGQALVLNRYVSDAESELCFCASDVVLLPYVKHFGSSSVLSAAAAAGKMVIATGAGLLKRRIEDHALGWLFPPQNVKALGARMAAAARLSRVERAGFREAALRYARTCSRERFRQALLAPYEYQGPRPG